MSTKKKDQLGKGLRALLTKIDKVETKATSGKATPEKASVVKELTHTIAKISLKKIEPNPFNPRIDFDETDMLELVQSIKALGLIQPITVRKMEADNYQIISGERRWRASKLAGLSEVPVYIRIADDQGMLEMALVENIQRSNLNALEIAITYQRLIDECNLVQEELGKRVGKNRSTVANYIRLLKLPPDIQSALRNGKLSMGHARALLSLENQTTQLQVFQQIIAEGLSVRGVEKIIADYKKQPPTAPPIEDKKTKPITEEHQEILKIKDRLSHNLGAKVEIQRNDQGKGKILIHFSSDDQFNNILDELEEKK